jgi:hypothetical protein
MAKFELIILKNHQDKNSFLNPLHALTTACTFALSQSAAGENSAVPKPLFRDFIGLNVHTVQFKPVIYLPATKLLRNYHPFDWDVGSETGFYLWLNP